MIGTWTYSGGSTVAVTFPSTAGHTYILTDNFDGAVVSGVASGPTFSLTITSIAGGYAGQRFACAVLDVTTTLAVCCTMCEFGSTASPTDGASGWTWDGSSATATTVTVARESYQILGFTAIWDGFEYTVVGGETTTGAGTSETLPGTLTLDGGWASIPSGAGIVVYLHDYDASADVSAVFGVKGSAGFTGFDAFGGGTPQPLEGLCVAFDVNPLDPPDSGWTRLDNYAGLSIERVEVTRGRPDETQKTDVGRMVVTGTDQNGVLDPTNHTGPFWDGGAAATKVDPVRWIGWAIKNPVTSVWAARYVGKIDTLTYTIDQSARFATFTIECVDDLDILSDAEIIPDQAGNAVPGESTGDCYYTGQQIDDRIRAVMADASTAFLGTTWPAEFLRIFSGNVAVQGRVYSARTTLITVIDEACDAEFPGIANRFVDRTGVFTFHGRYARFHPGDVAYGINTWKLGDIPAFNADGTVVVLNDPSNPVKFTRGKVNLINAAYAAPIGIPAADIAGQFVHDATSVAKYGPRSVSFDQLITEQGDEAVPLDANDETKLYSTYWVANYKVPQNRPQALTVKGVAASHSRAAATWAYLCGVELSDLVHVKTTHPGGGGFDDSFFVEQLKETYLPLQGDQYDVTTTAEVSPAAYFGVDPFSDTHTT